MNPEWKRKEWTTKCSDPTVVVQWSLDLGDSKKFEITEFQMVYTVRIGSCYETDPENPLVREGTIIHRKLEDQEWNRLYADSA